MGFADNFPAVGAAIASTLGREVTYAPAAGGTPFSVLAIIETVRVEALESRGYRDVTVAFISQSGLTDGGVTAPVSFAQGRPGDSITIDGVVWTVVEPVTHEITVDSWTVTLERDFRFVP